MAGNALLSRIRSFFSEFGISGHLKKYRFRRIELVAAYLGKGKKVILVVIISLTKDYRNNET